MTTQAVLGKVRSTANRFARDLVREVYDAEKFNGAGGEGLDGRDSEARRTFGRLVDVAEDVASKLS
ncbi:MAG: hypothetical protein K0S70_2203 [Microbacterium sp.]|nr:hypothetical protein [Microbacterium sp.]